jgi:hypothetical protein
VLFWKIATRWGVDGIVALSCLMNRCVELFDESLRCLMYSYAAIKYFNFLDLDVYFDGTVKIFYRRKT